MLWARCAALLPYQSGDTVSIAVPSRRGDRVPIMLLVVISGVIMAELYPAALIYLVVRVQFSIVLLGRRMATGPRLD